MESLCERYDFPKLANRMDEIHVNNLESPYQCWLKNSFVQILRDNLEHCRSIGVSLTRVKGVIRDRLGSQNSRIPEKKLIQRTAQELLSKHVSTPVHFRIRDRLERWYKQGRFNVRTEPEGIIARRAERRLTFSASNLPPRVHSAYFRTIWNGWCSERRFQTYIKGCRFGCGGDAEDSIEHYAFCPVVLEFFRRTHPTYQPFL